MIRGSIVFHATGLDPGSSIVKIEAPSLKRPFFVGDTKEMAKAYVTTFSYKSIWILTTKEDISKIAFDFSKESDLKKLGRWLPETVGWYRKSKSRSFFNLMWDMAVFVEDLFDLSSGEIDDAYNIYNKGNTKYMLGILKDLDIADGSGLSTTLTDYFLGRIQTSPGDTTFDSIRRALKSEVYKILSDEMDYTVIKDASTVLDPSTTGDEVEYSPGNEYAVLDKSVFGMSWSVSVDPKELDEVVDRINQKGM